MTRRQTIQKKAVLEAVRAAHPAHPTAADVLAAVRPTLPTLSFGTVYRVLHGLSEEGAINEVRQSCGPARYDADTTWHHHAVCSECGAIGDVRLSQECVLQALAQPVTAFEVDTYRIEFQGRCPHCRERRKDDAQPC